MQKLRLRVFALLVALSLLVFGVVGLFSISVLPAVGVAITIAVTVVNSMTSRLDVMVCAGCGSNIEKLPAGTHGIFCKKCGTINHPYQGSLAQFDPDYEYHFEDGLDDEQST